MPNYCQNKATFTHADKNKVDALFNEFKKLNTDEKGRPFELLYPLPESAANNWYEWRIENWGTKWDAIDVGCCLDREDDNTMTVSFSTAWSPPVGVYAQMEKDGWTVDAIYFEAGFGFAGEYSEGNDETHEIPAITYRILDAGFINAI